MKNAQMIIRSEKGESLVSVLLAMVITGVCLYATLSTFTGLQIGMSKPQVPAKVCREIAGNVLNKIRSSGAQAITFEVPESLGEQDSYRPEQLSRNKSVSEPGTSEIERRWPKKLIEGWNNNPPSARGYKVHFPRMIQSSVNLLLSIYNLPGNNACISEIGVDLLSQSRFSDIAPNKVEGDYEVKAYLKITPYSLKTGNLQACQHPLWLRPRAQVEPPQAQDEGIFDFSDYDPNKGLMAKVHIELIPSGQKGERHLAADAPKSTQCEETGRFQFDRRAEVPVTSEVNLGPNSLSVDVDRDEFMPGTIYMCRGKTHSDRHTGREGYSRASGARYKNQTYYKGPDEECQGNVMVPGSGECGVDPAKEFMGEWRSCDKINRCGRAIRAKLKDHKVDGKLKKRFAIDFENELNPNCAGELEIIAVNIFGNTSAAVRVPMQGPTYSDRGDRDNTSGFRVNGIEYRTLEAAKMASDITGQPLYKTSSIRFPRDAEMVTAYNASVSNSEAALQTMSYSSQANSFLSQSQAANASAQGASSSSSAAGGTAAAQAAHAGASSAASEAKSLADEAQRKADSAARQSQRYPNDAALAKAANEAKVMSDFAKKDAEEAKKAAEEAYRQYLEAKRREEELRRKEEEERERRRRERERSGFGYGG